MLFHRLCHLAKNTFLGEKLAEISSCVTSLASGRGKELVSSLHDTFKKKIRPMTFLLSRFITIWDLRDSVRVFTFCLESLLCPSLTDTCESREQNYSSQLLTFANHPLYLHLTCFHSHEHDLCLLSSFSFTLLFFFSFQKMLLGSLFFIVLVTVCTEYRIH